MLVLLGYIIIVISAVIYACSGENILIKMIALIAIVFSAWVVVSEQTKYGVNHRTAMYIKANLTEEQRKDYNYLMKNLPMQDREELSKELYFKIRRERDQKVRDLINDF